MVLMKYFCFCIPVRLGVLITSVMMLIKNLIALGVILAYDSDDIKSLVDSARDHNSKDHSNHDSQMEELYDIVLGYIRDYTDQFRWMIVFLCCAVIVSCIFNIIAAITKLRWLSIFYIIFVFIENLFMLAAHVNYMLMMKKSWNLGILIAACCVGGFILLFFFYLWGVTVAMFQMIGVVNGKEYKDMLLKRSTTGEDGGRKKSQRNSDIATIGSKMDYNINQELLTSDFYGLQKKNYRRI